MILSFFTHHLFVIEVFGKELVVTPFIFTFYVVLIILVLSFIIFLLRTYFYCVRFQQVDHYPGPFERTQWHRKAFRRWTRLEIDDDEEISDDDISVDNSIEMDGRGMEMTVNIPTICLSSTNVNVDVQEIPGSPFSPSVFFKGDFKETIV